MRPGQVGRALDLGDDRRDARHLGLADDAGAELRPDDAAVQELLARPDPPLGGEEREDFAVVGPAAGALLGEDDLAVADDVELGLLAADRRRVDARVSELGRETRGPSVVPVSDGAVEDLDGHRESV